MRGHKEDIYDLCWSPDSLKLLSGSVDNTAIVWDLTKGQNDIILTDHKGFVQGVSWDPQNQYIATLSTDRICRIYEKNGKIIRSRIQKGALPLPTNHFLCGKEVKYFHDDTFKSFFRRLDFSPCGTFLATPSGHVEGEDCKKTLSATYVFAVGSWQSPIAVLPMGKQCSTVVRFCPITFELHEDGPSPLLPLPYRLILAVGTDHDVILYDTQQSAPFAYFRDIHYTRLTDLAWSHDGLLLMASSTDGFCSFMTFEEGELGVKYVKEENEMEDILDISGCEELDDSLTDKVKKPNLLEKWAIKTPKHKDIEENKDKSEEQNKKRKEISECESKEDDKVVKRIKPITLEENKALKIEKRNPLLNFLKTPKNEKRRITPTAVKSSSPAVVLDEIEARDAWNCENKNKEGAFQQIPNNENETEEQTTEDFSLGLDDTIGREKFNKNIPTNTENNKITCNKNIDNEIEDSKETNKTEVTKNNEENGTKTHKPILEEQNNDKIGKIESEKVDTPKRRVALITLSSPRNKKK